MAIYYVRTDGSDTNAGTGPSINQAWQTLGKALGATGIASGDTLYIAPGVYRQSVTVAITNPTATTTIYGDLTASQFSGIAPGIVRVTNYNVSDNSTSTSGSGIINTRDYFTWRDITFVCPVSSSGSNTTFYRCIFESSTLSMGLTATANSNITIDSCIFFGRVSTAVSISFPRAASNYNPNMVIKNCYINIDDVAANPGIRFGVSGSGAGIANDVLITNCTIFHPSRGVDTFFASGFTGRMALIQNCLINSSTAAQCDVVGQIGLQNNRYSGATANVTLISGNTSTLSYMGIDTGQSRLSGIPNQMITNMIGSPNIGYGVTSNAPTVDLYNNAWSTGTPDAGSGAYVSNATTSFYFPTERNASTITIAPGSTSQSIELYLGATGLTASTSGLSAYYNRTRSADVQINLQARNITQNWTSGGFAEVNPNTMPGVYRLDIPNEALAAGADDVTVVVRGASGTNGAVMSIKLSSGGLTTAQTASAVWGALTNDHTTHGTFGWNVLRADQDSKEGLVTLHQSGGISRVDADVHAIANDTAAATALKGALNHDGTGYVDSDVVRISTSTAAANELEGALLHNGTDYIDSNLLSGNSTRVFVGRFQLTQTGTTQGDIIEAFTTDTPAFELQLFDGDNNIVPVTGATLGLRILDVTSTVVETGTPTIEYGTGGIVRWTAPGSYVSIGCPAGMYRLFVDRTVSGTTTTFGPLQIKVQVQ